MLVIICLLVVAEIGAGAAPDALETSVALMAKVGSSGSPSFSPDGKQLAFISNMTGLPQVWTVATEGGWPIQITALEDPVGSVSWSPDGAWLAFSVAPGGGMNGQIYLVRPDGTGLRRITDGGRKRITSAFGARMAGGWDGRRTERTPGAWGHTHTT